MEVSLQKKETESGWFDIKGGGRVHIRLLSADDITAMRKACFSTVAEYPLLDGEYRRFEAEKFDKDLWEDMTNDLSIIGWDVMVNAETKEPIAVTLDNKKLLMFPGVCPAFVEAVRKGRKALQKTSTEKVKAAEKNS